MILMIPVSFVGYMIDTKVSVHKLFWKVVALVDEDVQYLQILNFAVVVSLKLGNSKAREDVDEKSLVQPPFSHWAQFVLYI